MKRIIFTFLAIIVLIPASNASAHQSGCHRWHSCPSDTGSYVCGDLGYTSGCPKAVVVKPKPVTKTPTPAVVKKASTVKVPVAPKQKTYVNGYYRKDGTYVKGYWRN